MKILVPYTMRSKASENSLQVAQVYAKAFNASVHVVTSAEPSRSEKDLPSKEEAEQALWKVESMLQGQGITCTSHLLIQGHTPGEDIVHFAEEKGVDQIIIGVERRSRVGKLLMGSVAQHVILNAPCPVVTVKATDVDVDVYLGTRSMYEAD